MNEKAAGSGARIFPREIAPSTFWFNTCLEIKVGSEIRHNHNSCFLIVGSRASVLIDTAMPYGWLELRKQLKAVLGERQLDYIFPTHPEAPHMGNTGPLMDEFPAAKIVGDLRNYHLYFPELVDRFQPMACGSTLDLGERRLELVQAVIHDLPNTMWAYDPDERLLFVSDGYPYTHDHRVGECALTSEELSDPPTEEDTRPVIEGALNWTRYVDAEITIAALEEFLSRHPVDLIGPTHGGVITNPRELTETFKAGLRRVRAVNHV
jgi:flavorubredoxin